MRAAVSDKIPNGSWIGMIEQTFAILAGRIQHGTGKSRLGHLTDQLIVRFAIDEHHADKLGSLRDCSECTNAFRTSGTGEKTNLDIVDPGCRHCSDGSIDLIGLHGQIADDGAHWPPAGDNVHCITYDKRFERA